jgi:hypothetical protein
VLNCLNTAQTGHSNIHYGNIGQKLGSQPHSLFTVACNSYDFQFIFLPKKATQSLAKRSMIVSKKDLDFLLDFSTGLQSHP